MVFVNLAQPLIDYYINMTGRVKTLDLKSVCCNKKIINVFYLFLTFLTFFTTTQRHEKAMEANTVKRKTTEDIMAKTRVKYLKSTTGCPFGARDPKIPEEKRTGAITNVMTETRHIRITSAVVPTTCSLFK